MVGGFRRIEIYFFACRIYYTSAVKGSRRNLRFSRLHTKGDSKFSVFNEEEYMDYFIDRL